MLLERNYNSSILPVEQSSMSHYPNVLTPPSSSEDSPQPVYFVASPTSSSFHAPENYATAPVPTFDIPPTHTVIDPHMMLDALPKATLQFVEQPTDKFRFRYKSEMAGTHGSLTGYNSDKSRKQTYPTVELKNCSYNAIIRCSVYQLNSQGRDFMPHAHRLIMKKGKEEHDDPHDLVVGPEDGWRATFHGMGIIHTAKKNIVTELIRKKTQLKLEYIARTEGRHRDITMQEKVEIKGLAEGESKSINLNIVCLRFDAFIKQNDILFPICEPIYSHGINNLKSALTGELKIVRLDHCTSPARGGKEVFILVERVTKKNIKIRFFELDDKDDEVWSAYGKFNDLDVHHQYAIVFKTPKYRDENINNPVKVFIELVRPSDNAKSEPREFKYVPSSFRPGSKRPRSDYDSSSYESSNFGSDELPAVIHNLNLEPNTNLNITQTLNIQPSVNSWNEKQLLTSEELAIAVNNIGSEEFLKLFNQFDKDNGSCISNVLDTPALDNKNFPRKIGMEQHSEMPYRAVKSQVELLPQIPPVSAVKKEVPVEDIKRASRHYDELKSFMKGTHKSRDIPIKFINHYLGEENKTNVLHVFVCQNNIEAATYILKLIIYYQQLHLVNIKNNNSETPLQLAVFCHNVSLVQLLMLCKAKVADEDSKMNTVLHTALEENVSKDILDLLLRDREHEKIKEYIDATNFDGNTALMIAIENKNLLALKLLCTKGADINKWNMKNGFTPLRLAIEKQYLDIIKYILSLQRMDPSIGDFKDVSPLAAAHRRECSKEIMEIIEKYMLEKNLEIEIKEELEDDSDEEMEEELVKSEPFSMEELEDLYKKCHAFSPQCLEEVSAILNESGKWEHLADLLDVGYFIRCGMISREPNVSKNLLTFAVETHNDTIWEIRNFLENLDEIRAVEIIDKMMRDSQ